MVCSPGPALDAFARDQSVLVHPVPMERRIVPSRDIRALRALVACLRGISPTIVHAHTPKAGFLAMVAAWLLRVPVRIYHIHGFPFLTAPWSERGLLKATERVSCLLAHQALCVSRSVMQLAIQEHVCSRERIKVLLNGSINGVDATSRFNPDRLDTVTRSLIRKRYAIPEEVPVAGFAGRLVRDKGVIELARAWEVVRRRCPSAHLLVVGQWEARDAVPTQIRQQMDSDPSIHMAGCVRPEDMPAVYSAMDVLVLPSRREGFPLVALEAAAMGLPVVATNIPGCSDAVEHGITGMLVPPDDSVKLASAMCDYLEQPTLRSRHGNAGRQRVLVDFSQRALWEAQYEEYIRLLRIRDVGARAVTSQRECGVSR